MDILFYIFAILSVISGFMVVSERHPVRSALWLIFTFFCFGVIYLLMGAELIAAIQVMVYAGAIMVLFLFVIMLLNLEKIQEEAEVGRKVKRVWGAIFAILLFSELTYLIMGFVLSGKKDVFSPSYVEKIGGNVKAVSHILFKNCVFPFEITSILLLVAIVGAVVMAKKELK